MIVHKGEIVENAVRQSGFPIKLLSERLGRSRTHVYNIFNNPDVSLDTILLIGKIIQHDFSSELSDLSKIPEEYKLDLASEPIQGYENISYWKSKYFELLEQHKLLLQKNFSEYFEKINS